MITEYNYTNIRNVLDRLHRHPLLQDVTLDQVIQYTIDFIYIFGMPKMYQDKEITIHINDYRAELPCDLILINQVKNLKTNTCLRLTSDSFYNSDNNKSIEDVFRTQGQVIFTSFKTGDIIVSYKSIPIDKDGFPLLIDNALFLKTLETYIKREIFTILFDMGKIQSVVLQNVQQQYSWLAGQLYAEFTIPSVSEMESIKNSWCTLLQRSNSFRDGFKNNSNQEFLKVQ